MGDSDVDTFANITRADYDFDDEAFDAVTQNAKDFISTLLVHRKEDRLSAKQCLESIWLSQQNDESSSKIRICTDKLKKFIIRRKWQVCIIWNKIYEILLTLNFLREKKKQAKNFVVVFNVRACFVNTAGFR